MPERLSGKALRKWIVDRLTILRGRTGESTEEFAEHVGITPGYIYKLERYESEPSIEVVDAWLFYCKEDLATFFQELAQTGSRHPEHAEWHDRLDVILDCPPEWKVNDVSVSDGIKLNLIAVAHEAERMKREKLRDSNKGTGRVGAKSRAAPPLPSAGEGMQDRKVGTTSTGSQKKGRAS